MRRSNDNLDLRALLFHCLCRDSLNAAVLLVQRMWSTLRPLLCKRNFMLSTQNISATRAGQIRLKRFTTEKMNVVRKLKQS